MKKVLFVLTMAVLIVGAAPVFADMHTVDVPTAIQFRSMGVSTGDYETLSFVGANPGVNLLGATPPNVPFYGVLPMQYSVGFSGNMYLGYPGDDVASMYIGLADPAGLSSEDTGFNLSLANDDQQMWDYKLYAKTDAGHNVIEIASD